jgi:hypothetical protein
MRNLIAVVSLVALAPFTTGGLTAAEENSQTKNAHVDLSVGAAAPIFKSVDDRGRPWASGDHVGKQYVVIYFTLPISRPAARSKLRASATR